MFLDDNEDYQYFDLNTVHTTSTLLHTHDQPNQQALHMLGELQAKQAELKWKVFEATESTILHNKRAYIKKIKHRNYPTGQNVLFRNPNSAGLASTLNVREKVIEKLGKDLYRVKYIVANT